MRVAWPLGAVACILLAAVLAEASSLTRDRDPIVMMGQELPSLLGLPVDRVVAFRYQAGWQQIPVQIDERKLVDFGVVYNQSPIGVVTLAYADPNTYTGADTDPNIDTDDEIVCMAGDAGDKAPLAGAAPAGVIASSGLEVEIVDPLDGGQGFIYLFETSGSLFPDAGLDYVSYAFNLLAGSYIPDYKTAQGPNPEDSEAGSALYRTHFSDRWIRDELNMTTPGSSGVDILDRHKNMFGPGICARTEDTFSDGEGAFFVNKDGPVRAIRSYMGANSGPLTQRRHVFYEGRQDISTFLRVHSIEGVMDVYDYSSGASGMAYYNDLNTAGVPVDGSPDVVATGALSWEMVAGVQGSLIVAAVLETDISGLSYTSYYSDDSTPSVTQCTGDAFEYATSGVWVDHGIPNTDPSLGAFNVLTGQRVIYYESPGLTPAAAALRYDQATTPLEVTTRPYVSDPAAVPTLPGWGMVAMAGLLLASAVLMLAWRGVLPQSQSWIEPSREDQRL
jgi:hypothetical protein